MTTTRTITVFLTDFGSESEITAHIDDVQFFSGALDAQDPKISFEVPLRFAGKKILKMKVNKGAVITSSVQGNYCLRPNPVFTEEELVLYYDKAISLSDKLELAKSKANPAIPTDAETILLDSAADPEEVDVILRASNVTGAVSTGPSGFGNINKGNPVFSNLKIDGVLQPDEERDWGHMVHEGSTLTAEINIEPGYDKNTAQNVNEGF